MRTGCVTAGGQRVSLSCSASDALVEQALYARQPEGNGGLIHHSDGGSQYVGIRYIEGLAEMALRHRLAAVATATITAYRRMNRLATQKKKAQQKLSFFGAT
ncbi:hypothetical protein F506_02555 [Herbaspirillum hiltneri N3]|uniref:Integrase-like protein n=1 Tax=Herbaspirillum hiltneri N3 TaxID=1262470 RepID=A0ABN4HT67_9BURK|nr:hypothetical protein F506_02555 [Herbaspirillum hiltneri N3]